MLSFSTPEYVVRKTVSAISSAIEKMAFLNSSKAIGSMPYYPWMSKRCGWDARTGKMRASRSHKGADDGTQHQEAGGAKATPLHSRAAAAPPDRAGRHAQGRMAVSRRCGAENLASRRAALSRPRHQPRG